MNTITINGEFTQKAPMRYTPAGLAVLEGVLHHESEVMEAAMPRKLIFEMPFKAVGEMALALDKVPLGTYIQARGFLAPKSARFKQLIVHITQYS